jgi:hypothetical protein
MTPSACTQRTACSDKRRIRTPARPGERQGCRFPYVNDWHGNPSSSETKPQHEAGSIFQVNVQNKADHVLEIIMFFESVCGWKQEPVVPHVVSIGRRIIWRRRDTDRCRGRAVIDKRSFSASNVVFTKNSFVSSRSCSAETWPVPLCEIFSSAGSRICPLLSGLDVPGVNASTRDP